MVWRMAACLALVGAGWVASFGLAQETGEAPPPPIHEPAPLASAPLTPMQYDQRIAELEAAVADLQQWRCCEPTDQDRTGPWLYAGYSFLFTKLHYKESFQATVNDFGTGTLNLLPFEQDYELTPRVWIGARTPEGLGARASYWNFDHASDPLTLVSNGVQIPAATSTSVIYPAAIAAAFPGDQLTVNSSLDATTVDLEGTYDLRVRRLELNLGGGVRYLHFDQRYDAVVTPGPVPGATAAALSTMREFEGLGPLMTAQARLPLGERGFYATGGVEVCFLFGEKTLTRTVLNDATPAPNTTLPIVVLNQSDEITGVYGVRIGGGWRRDTSRGRIFIETAYESQLWTDGGAPTITFAGFNGFSATTGVEF